MKPCEQATTFDMTVSYLVICLLDINRYEEKTMVVTCQMSPRPVNIFSLHMPIVRYQDRVVEYINLAYRIVGIILSICIISMK